MDIPSLPPEVRTSPTASGQQLRATRVDGEIHLRVPYQPALVAKIRDVPGRRWDPKRRVWRIPDTSENRLAIKDILSAELSRAEHSPPMIPGDALPQDADPPTTAARDRSQLLDRFDEEMRLRGYSLRTRKAYRGHADSSGTPTQAASLPKGCVRMCSAGSTAERSRAPTTTSWSAPYGCSVRPCSGAPSRASTSSGRVGSDDSPPC